MRLGIAAAALGALLFAAPHAAHAAPAANLKGAAAGTSSSSLVELAGKRGGNLGVGGGWAGPRASGGGGPKMSARSGGPKMGGYGGKGGPKIGAYKGGKGYAGKGPRGGDWDRGGRRGGYAWKGDRRHYGRYLYPGIGLGLAYGGAYAYGDGCGWLYRRAQATGSPYWWQRFEECRYSYY